MEIRLLYFLSLGNWDDLLSEDNSCWMIRENQDPNTVLLTYDV